MTVLGNGYYEIGGIHQASCLRSQALSDGHKEDELELDPNVFLRVKERSLQNTVPPLKKKTQLLIRFFIIYKYFLSVSLSLHEALPVVCTLPSERGPCQGRHTRYYYNPKSRTCEKFVYSGCSGNGNRFYSAQACKETCEVAEGPPTPSSEHPSPLGKNVAGLPRECTLPSDHGPCKGDYIRYFYNSKSKKCETFVYGGCLGNGNTFNSLDDCEKICKVSRGPHSSLPKPPNVVSATIAALPAICTLLPDTGPCQQYHSRYYYNMKRQKCEKFVYGGCFGNGNRFTTSGACRKKCKTSSGDQK
nr:carboxypeptidase inhibitor SmCI-like [Pogona vitticeps]